GNWPPRLLQTVRVQRPLGIPAWREASRQGGVIYPKLALDGLAEFGARVDSPPMRPPCISTICLAMASPSPVPPLALVSEQSTCAAARWEARPRSPKTFGALLTGDRLNDAVRSDASGCCNKSPLPIRPPRQRGRSSNASAAVTSSRVANRGPHPRMYKEPVGSIDRRYHHGQEYRIKPSAHWRKR